MTRETFRKILVTPELLEKVNPENIKLRDQFLKEKNARSSDKTIISYLSDLNIFFVYTLLYNDNKFFVDYRKIELSSFFNYCLDQLKWSSSRYNRMKSCLSSFSNFILKYLDDIYPNFKPIVLNSIDNMPKNLVREKTILTDEQIDKLFKDLKDANEIQVICWLALAIASGSRFAELLRFEVDNIDGDHLAFNDIFIETLRPIKSKGRTKTGKMSLKYIIKDLFWDKYNDWLLEREKILVKNNKSHNFIFIKKNGDPADESTARGWINKIQHYISVPFYAHALRHRACSYLSRKKIPYALIKELFSWESIDMISIYDDNSAKDKDWPELENLKTKSEDISSK